MNILHHVIITVFLITSIVLLITPQHAYASTCAVKETIYSAPEFYLLSDNVFVGNVTSITDYGNHQWQVHFNIEKIWKGVVTRQTSTVMAYTLQACGYSITVGEKYLIYTNGSPSTINPIYSKLYSDAQNDIALFDDPKFQSEEKVKEDLNKKLEVAQGTVESMMRDKSSHIPINGVGVDKVNSTLDIMIDDERATLSVEQYTQNLKNILGNLPIKVEFGHATTATPILHNANDSGLTTSHPIIRGLNSSNVLESPLKQFKSGIAANDVKCGQGLQLVIKAEDGSPACVKQDTIEKLVGRGWSFPVEVQSQNKSNKISADTQQQPYTNITINGLKENYTLNEPIVFYIAIEGYGTGCGDAKAIITKENDSQYKSPVWGIGSSCASNTKQNHFKFNTLSVNTSINQTGNYILTASFDDFVTYPHTTEKKFSVITELR